MISVVVIWIFLLTTTQASERHGKALCYWSGYFKPTLKYMLVPGHFKVLWATFYLKPTLKYMLER